MSPTCRAQHTPNQGKESKGGVRISLAPCAGVLQLPRLAWAFLPPVKPILAKLETFRGTVHVAEPQGC